MVNELHRQQLLGSRVSFCHRGSQVTPLETVGDVMAGRVSERATSLKGLRPPEDPKGMPVAGERKVRHGEVLPDGEA